MSTLQIILLGIIQGAAELLPVSSSAHVIVAEKLMGLDPSSPEMTFLLVMLHTGTMFAMIAYFWRAWRESFGSVHFRSALGNIVIATLYTLGIGFGLQVLIEKVFARGVEGFEVENLFSNLTLIGISLAAGGIVILVSGVREERKEAPEHDTAVMPISTACWIGAIQGLALPFRGFSRSGATISTGLFLGLNKIRSEEFSFILAVVLTPAVVGKELLRLLKAHAEAQPTHAIELFVPGLIGMVFSFVAGLVALRVLSGILKAGRWWYFGVYCLAASIAVLVLAHRGY